MAGRRRLCETVQSGDSTGHKHQVMEHKAFEMDALLNICAGARAGNVDTIVRIIKGGYTSIIWPIEAGACSIMAPHVMDTDETRDVVRMSRCQPIGRKPIDMVGADADYSLMAPEEYVRLRVQ